jgi:DNA polymerase
MDEIQREFLEIVTQLRTHLEYQKALGVRHIETVSVRTIATETSPASATSLTTTREELGARSQAALDKTETQAIICEGNPNAAIVFIGAVTGREKDRAEKLFAGPADKLLTDIIVKGMKLKREDVCICGIESRSQPDTRESWEPLLKTRLQAINPRVIVALGDVASKALLNTTEDFSLLRGKWHVYDNMPLMPTFDPSHLLNNPQDKKPVWEDIQKVMGKLKTGARSQESGVRGRHE